MRISKDQEKERKRNKGVNKKSTPKSAKKKTYEILHIVIIIA